MGGRSRGRVKRQQVASDDGWTVITHGLSGLSLDKGAKTDEDTGSSSASNPTHSLPPRTVSGMTPESLLADFKKLQQRWVDTACAAHVARLLADRTWNVTDAVCIGIGSFSRDWEHRHRALWQLVLFLDVVEKLGESAKMYAQDPALTSLDTDFLSLLSITTTSTIESHISQTSFVFSPFVDWFLLLPTFLANADPALYVGNEILDDYSAYAHGKEKREKLEECNELGSVFLGKREGTKLASLETHAHALEGMLVYWRKEVEVGAEEKKEEEEQEVGDETEKGDGNKIEKEDEGKDKDDVTKTNAEAD